METCLTTRPTSQISFFWRCLIEDGQVSIIDDTAPEPAEIEALNTLLTEMDNDNRLRLAFEPPVLDLAVAHWACVLFFRACQFFVFRDCGADLVKQDLSLPAPGELSASTVYSADLALQHLGEITALAGGIAPEDPLTIQLKRLGQKWPLSSVGTKNLSEFDTTIGNACL